MLPLRLFCFIMAEKIQNKTANVSLILYLIFRYATKKGAMDNFQTLNSFSLGVSALEHSKSKKKR